MASAPTDGRVPRYGHELAALILARCAERPMRPGGRMPTERQLADELGVTRTMVRHALAVLEAEGRISREVGRGTFIRDPTALAARASAAGRVGGADVGPGDVMAARKVIEPQVLPLVVAWATPRDFDELRRCLERGGAARSYEEFEVCDYALHHAIVAASRNALLVAMYAEIERARKGQIWGDLKRLGDSRERRASYQADHVELVDALCARDLPRAVDAMQVHLARVEANLLGAQRQRDET